MSAELRRLVDRELESLRRLVEVHREVIDAAMRSDPGLIEREALAVMLHSFYTGVETVMRSVAMLSRDRFSKSEAWHSELLTAMQSATDARPALLSPDLGGLLGEYLTFRHRFRNLYGFDLEWQKMKPLVAGAAQIGHQFEAAVREFVRGLPPAA